MRFASFPLLAAAAVISAFCTSCTLGPDATPSAPVSSEQALSAASAPRSFRASLHALTATGPETIDRSPGPVPGSTRLKVRDGNAQVMVARKNADGTVTTGCVSSGAEADAFIAAPVSSEGGIR